MEDRLPRKLAAILYADVAGYSRLMGEDEEGTHRRLSEYLDLISGTVERHQGRVVHYAGDAVLADFGTVTEALSCATSIQHDLASRNGELPDDRKVQFRIGVNLGEVIVDRDDIYGDGVNVAARLESLADPGGVCISESVRTAAGKKLDLAYQFLGEQRVKNIEEPVRAYKVVKSAVEARSSEVEARAPEAASSAERPSVAVLPWAVIGEDPEVGRLADGITDNIINTLSRTGQCRVADRASAFAYKGQSPRPIDVAEALGVQHVLQGSLQRSRSRVRITAELFGTRPHERLWSERWDRTLEDEFELEDEIAKDISQAIRMIVVHGKGGRAWQRPTTSFEAWLLNVQAVEHFLKGSQQDIQQARSLLERVMAIDPRYIWGPCNLCWSHCLDCRYAWSDAPERSLDEAMTFAKRALGLDPHDPWAILNLATVHMIRGDHDLVLELGEKAFLGSGDDPYLDVFVALFHCLGGDLERAHKLIIAAFHATPNPDWFYCEVLGLCELLCGRHRGALSAFGQAVTLAADPTFPHALSAVVHVELGEPDRARAEMDRALDRRPELSLRHFRYYLTFRDSEQRERFGRALISAGLPE